MKVGDISVFWGQGENAPNHRIQRGGSFYAGGLNQQEDPIFQKKQQARQKAMKIVKDTLDSDVKLDKEQQKRRENVKELTEQLHELEGYLADQQNMPEEELTPEMQKARQDAIAEYTRQCAAVENEIKAENIVIEATKIERLKASPMVKAQEAAEEILESAGEEIVDMILQDTKERIDEEQEEREEQAEKAAEKKEEEEERIAKSEQEREEAEAMAEAIKQAATSDVQKEIEKMLDELKLLEEDIKGAAVDTVL